jgi:hypothetical protein
LSDGWTYNYDLTGGYYDAGDNVKFGFPMAFTTTMLAWSVIEFRDKMPPNELRNALVAIRWSTDYLLKTISQPNRIFVQVLTEIRLPCILLNRCVDSLTHSRTVTLFSFHHSSFSLTQLHAHTHSRLFN